MKTGLIIILRSICIVAVCVTVSTIDLRAQNTPNGRGAQSKPGQPVSEATTKPTRSAAPCPDRLYQKACKSYAELREARDPGVRTTVAPGGFAYACFREPADEFFIVELDGPTSWNKVRFDPKKKATVPEDGAESRGIGWARVFVNGIVDGSGIPFNPTDHLS